MCTVSTFRIASSMVVHILGELSEDTIVLPFQRNSELTFELPSLPLSHYSVLLAVQSEQLFQTGILLCYFWLR